MSTSAPVFDAADIEHMRADFVRVVCYVRTEPRIEISDAQQRTLRRIASTFGEIPDVTIIALFLMNDHLHNAVAEAMRVRLMLVAVGAAPHIEDALWLANEFVPLLDNFRPGREPKLL